MTGTLYTTFAVVVYVFDVLIESDIEFPLMGQLALDGADSSCDVKFSDSGVGVVKIDECIHLEVVVGASGLAEVEVIVVVAVGEAYVEIGDVVEVVGVCHGVNTSVISDVSVTKTNLEGVGLRVFFLACMEVVDTEHFARQHAVHPTDRVKQGADDFTQYAGRSSLGVVEENVGDAMGDLADGGATNACRQEVIVGRAVGLAKKFPCEGTCKRVEQRSSVGKPVFSCGIVEHAAMVRMCELVARETVVVPHPSTSEVLFYCFVGDACPFAVSDKVVPTEHQGIDAEVFDKGLEARRFCCPVGLLPEEMERAGIGGECVRALQMGTYACDGVVPDGIWLYSLELAACHEEQHKQ